MKLYVVFQLLIVLIFVSTCLCQVNEDLIFTDKDTFLNLRCGMSKEEVEKAVNVKLKYNEKTRRYSLNDYVYHDMPSMMYFKFKQDKLISSFIYPWINNKNTSDMINDFFRIKKILEDEYGEYYYNGTSWKAKIENPTLEDYVGALEHENVDFHFIWRTNKMDVDYMLYKDASDPLMPYNMLIHFLCDSNPR